MGSMCGVIIETLSWHVKIVETMLTLMLHEISNYSDTNWLHANLLHFWFIHLDFVNNVVFAT